MHGILGYTAFCGRSPQHEETLAEECGEMGEPIYGTNLTSLITGEDSFRKQSDTPVSLLAFH